MLKVGVVGVGGISAAHIDGWHKIEEAQITAMCDIRPERMEPHPYARHYLSFDEMLEKEPLDVLDICLPTYLHVEFALKALEKGINVLCEKPLSLDAADAKRVYDTAKENGVKFMVAQVLRFWPEYTVVKELYENGTYGRLLSGSMERLGARPRWSWDGWMTDEKRSGLVPFDLHVHDLDFMVYAFGAPQKTACYRSKRDDQDYLNAVYTFDGFSITSEAAWYAPPMPFVARFRFQFEDAVVVNEGGLKIYEKNGNVVDAANDAGGDTGKINLPKTSAYFEEIRYFADCVLQDKAPDKVKPEELETVISILKSM